MRKRAYRQVLVKEVRITEVVSRLAPGPVWVGLDVAKREVVAVVRDSADQFERPWKARQPEEIGELVGLLRALSAERSLQVALEPTGTYGDSLRQALGDAGLAVRRVSGKAAKDYSEVFDGVPSAHDGKDAAVIAELAAIGKSQPWPSVVPSGWEAEVRGQVRWLDAQQGILQTWQGQLESLVSRHWPELTRLLSLKSATLLRVLRYYGSPAAMAADADASVRLAKWGKQYLRPEKVARLVESARLTAGVRLTTETTAFIQRFAHEAWKARAEIRQTQKALRRLAGEHPTVVKMAQVVSPATACVLYAALGDPGHYHCAEAYRKGFGLNLKERSSGQYQGRLKITKRGPSVARRWLFLAALRYVTQPTVRAWFERKKARDQGRALPAVVGVMRKLALAIHAVAAGQETFDPARLFPGCSLSPRRVPAAVTPEGAPPPAPRDLSLSSQNRELSKADGAAGVTAQPPRRSVLDPGAALGLVPTRALSSAQGKQV